MSENWAERRRMARLKAVSRYSATGDILQLPGICWHPVECATENSCETQGGTARAIVRSSLTNLSGMGAFLFRPGKETMYHSILKKVWAVEPDQKERIIRFQITSGKLTAIVVLLILPGLVELRNRGKEAATLRFKENAVLVEKTRTAFFT